MGIPGELSAGKFQAENILGLTLWSADDTIGKRQPDGGRLDRVFNEGITVNIESIERMLGEIESAEAAEAAARSAEARQQLAGAIDPSVNVIEELRRFLAGETD